MPSKLSTTISKIAAIPNPTNSMLISEFHNYMETSGASERHQNNSLKMVIAFVIVIFLQNAAVAYLRSMLGHCKMILEDDQRKIAIHIYKLITALRTAV